MADVITWEAPDGPHPARAAARQSMTAVAEGRKDDWLALFAPDALVEDPVGPSCANVSTITMWLGDSGGTMKVDMVSIYTVDEEGKITSLRAHWEPDRAMATITTP